MPIPANQELYDKVKKLMDKKYEKPSAYKSGAIVKLYKQLGGTYIEDGKERDLERWFDERWVNVADKGQYPVLRPTIRINKNTPLTIDEIDKDNLKEQIKLKQKIKGNLPSFEGGAIRTDKIQKLSASSYMDNKDIKNLKNHKLDKSLSTNEVKVWVNPKKKEIYVANRGTKGLTDWINNLSYVLGQYDRTKRYDRAKQIQMIVKSKYPNYKITNIGHSQGSAITRQLNKEGLTDEIININPATIYNDSKNKPNEYTIKSRGDIVSIFHQPNKNTIQVDNKTFNPIIEHKTDILDRIPKRMIGTGFFIEC
jgi:hypothetical protein